MWKTAANAVARARQGTLFRRESQAGPAIPEHAGVSPREGGGNPLYAEPPPPLQQPDSNEAPDAVL